MKMLWTPVDIAVVVNQLESDNDASKDFYLVVGIRDEHAAIGYYCVNGSMKYCLRINREQFSPGNVQDELGKLIKKFQVTEFYERRLVS